jgi:hypothetical protein
MEGWPGHHGELSGRRTLSSPGDDSDDEDDDALLLWQQQLDLDLIDGTTQPPESPFSTSSSSSLSISSVLDIVGEDGEPFYGGANRDDTIPRGRDVAAEPRSAVPTQADGRPSPPFARSKRRRSELSPGGGQHGDASSYRHIERWDTSKVLPFPVALEMLLDPRAQATGARPDVIRADPQSVRGVIYRDGASSKQRPSTGDRWQRKGGKRGSTTWEPSRRSSARYGMGWVVRRSYGLLNLRGHHHHGHGHGGEAERQLSPRLNYHEYSLERASSSRPLPLPLPPQLEEGGGRGGGGTSAVGGQASSGGGGGGDDGPATATTKLFHVLPDVQQVAAAAAAATAGSLVGGATMPGAAAEGRLFTGAQTFRAPNASHEARERGWLRFEDSAGGLQGKLYQVSQNGYLLSRRGRSLPANASGFDTHRDLISSRFDCRARTAPPSRAEAATSPSGSGDGRMRPRSRRATSWASTRRACSRAARPACVRSV